MSHIDYKNNIVHHAPRVTRVSWASPLQREISSRDSSTLSSKNETDGLCPPRLLTTTMLVTGSKKKVLRKQNKKQGQLLQQAQSPATQWSELRGDFYPQQPAARSRSCQPNVPFGACTPTSSGNYARVLGTVWVPNNDRQPVDAGRDGPSHRARAAYVGPIPGSDSAFCARDHGQSSSRSGMHSAVGQHQAQPASAIEDFSNRCSATQLQAVSLNTRPLLLPCPRWRSLYPSCK